MKITGTKLTNGPVNGARRGGGGGGVISVEEEDWVKVNDPKPARLYANVKTHKDDWPYMFILSSKGTATEKLARWIEWNLNEMATKHKAYIRDAKAFLLYLEHLNENMGPFPSGTRMISWDIKNFYPNCETIVPQLSKCLKFEAIRGDQTDQRICN